jgi:ribosomal protein S27AE
MNLPGQSGERMRCPRCGAAMNHHADKVLYFNEGDENRSPDSGSGSFIEEIHGCPSCGASASRPANDRETGGSTAHFPK